MLGSVAIKREESIVPGRSPRKLVSQVRCTFKYSRAYPSCCTIQVFSVRRKDLRLGLRVMSEMEIRLVSCRV